MEAKSRRLDDLVDVVADKVTLNKDPARPYVGLEHLASGSPDLLGTAPSASSVSTNSVFAAGDSLFGKLRPNLRKAVIAPFAGYCSTDILVLRSREGAVPRYVGRLMQSETVAGAAIRTAIGTKMPRTSWAAIRGVHVHAPSAPEQRCIADILDEIDEAIRKTKQLIAKLRQVTKGLLHDLITRGIDNNGEIRDARRHPEQFKDSTLGRSPKAWNVETLGSVSTVVRGSTPRPAKDPRYFGGDFMPWITVGELSRDDWPYLTTTSTRLTELGASFSRPLEVGTLVLSNSGFGCGVPKLLQLRGCANDGIAAFLDVATSAVPLFLYYYLFSQIHILRNRVARGVDQPNLNTDLLRLFPVPLPSVAEQQEISRRLFAAAVRERAEQAYLEKLLVLRQGVLEDLVTGRAHVVNLSSETAA